MPARIPATLIPGDGIGPEIVDATLLALDALGAPFEWDRQVAGLAGVQQAGDPLPAAALDSIRRTRLALKGPLETPSGGGYRSSNVRLREAFQLYANLRPARTLVPGGRYDNVDLVVVRENLEGLYIGHEHYVQIDDDPHAVAMATGINTRQGCRRLLQFAFEHAIATGRKKVTVVHKANIMKALTGIFLETAQQMHESTLPGPHRDGDHDRRRVRDEARARPVALRRRRHHQPVRRHPVRPRRRPGRRARHGAGRQHRRRRGHLRGRARLGAGHRRQGHRQPDGADAGGRDDARPRASSPTWRPACAEPSKRRSTMDKVRTGDLGGSATTEQFAKALAARIRNG